MANNQNYTVFQKLTRMFGFPGVAKKEDTPSFNFNKDELLKTSDKNEFDKAMLQAQQSSYIADKWAKLDQSLYNQSVYYEPNRLAAYYDYESMEFTPEISDTSTSPIGEVANAVCASHDLIEVILQNIDKYFRINNLPNFKGRFNPEFILIDNSS